MHPASLDLQAPVTSPFGSDEDFDAVIAGTISSIQDIDQIMRRVMRLHFDDLPFPGNGATSARWRILATVARQDLSLAKIFESHVDAQAILNELGHSAESEKLLAVWAAENPKLPLTFDPATSRLTGGKQWCSGASIVDEGLLTARTPAGESVLVRVGMKEAGVAVKPCAWANAGIAGAETTSLTFENTPSTQVGEVAAYLDRPGFWQGGAGIAAVWYGGAVGVAAALAAASKIGTCPHAAAHFGEVYSQLEATRALLLQTASWIDENPFVNAAIPARTLRAVAESAATETLLRVGRALGAVPLCVDAAHARRVADLEIYLRQSHAESDLAELGRTAAGRTWTPLW